MAKKNRDIPVYLFTGFLEAGKTRFIQETLEDKRFNNGERTLILLCEESYDVPRRNRNDDADGSDSVHHYILCAVCPHCVNGKCTSDNPAVFDRRVAEAAGVHAGDVVTWKDFSGKTEVLNRTALKEICAGCRWLQMCIDIAGSGTARAEKAGFDIAGPGTARPKKTGPDIAGTGTARPEKAGSGTACPVKNDPG